MQLKPINQQVVAVVGASSGIGRETALNFAKRGAKVVVCARSESGLKSLVDEIRSFGGEATAITADVSEFEQVRAIADKAIEIYGRLDTWVHCAAVNLYATFEQTTPEEFKLGRCKFDGTSIWGNGSFTLSQTRRTGSADSCLLGRG